MPLSEMNRKQGWLSPTTLAEPRQLRRVGYGARRCPTQSAAYYSGALLDLWLYGFMTNV